MGLPSAWSVRTAGRAATGPTRWKEDEMAKLRHIAIRTRDPEKPPPGTRRSSASKRWAGRAAASIRPTATSLAVLLTNTETTRGEVAPGFHHFGFLVENLDATCEKLAAAGAERLPSAPQAGNYFEAKHLGPDGVEFDVSAQGWAGASPL